MRSKKFAVYTFGVLLTFLLLLSLVAAQPGGTTPPPDSSTTDSIVSALTNLIDGIQRGGSPIFGALLGKTAEGSDLFTKVLFFIIVTLIVMVVLGKVTLFEDKQWAQVLIGIVVAIIGVRFLPENAISALTLPSTALVAVLVVGVPFFVFGAIITRFDNSYVRRAGWTIYAVMLLILWLYNIKSGWHWIYPLFVLGCIIAFMFDGTLQGFLRKAKAGRTVEEFSSVTMHTSAARIKELQTAIATEQDATERAKMKRELTRLKAAMKDVAETA